MKAKAFLFSVILAGAAFSGHAVELLKNGGFETGPGGGALATPGTAPSAADFWLHYVNNTFATGSISSTLPPFSQTLEPPKEGTRVFRATATGTNGTRGVIQTFAPQSSPVTFSAWVHVFNQTSALGLAFGNGTNVEIITRNSIANQWQFLQATSTLPNVDRVMVITDQNNIVFDLDAASATVVPEPATLSILAVAGGALLKRRRK